MQADIALLHELDRVITVLGYFFNILGLKLAFIGGIVNILKHILTEHRDTKNGREQSKFQVISEALFVSVFNYSITQLLIDKGLSQGMLYLIALVSGLLGFAFISKIIQSLTVKHLEKLTTLQVDPDLTGSLNKANSLTNPPTKQDTDIKEVKK